MGCKLLSCGGYNFNRCFKLLGGLQHALSLGPFGHVLCFGGFGHSLAGSLCLLHGLCLALGSLGKAIFKLFAHVTHGGKEPAVFTAIAQAHIYF